MKSKQFICAAAIFAACAFSANAYSQLEVKTSGDVKASKDIEVVDSLKVGSSALIEDNLNVNNNANIDNNLTVGSDLGVSQHLSVGGHANITNYLRTNKSIAIEAAVNNNVSLNISHTSNTTSPYYGVESVIKTRNTMPTGSVYGIYGCADAYESSSSLPTNNVVGVYGRFRRDGASSTNFYAGVAGLAYYYGGIGVYGGIGTESSQLPTKWSGGCYAGYFNGTVKVNGTLFATAVSTTSDERYKENVQKLSSVANTIQLLQPVSYTLKQDSAWTFDKEAKELQGIHYGLIAQDVQKILPEIVYQRGEQLSINYIELIPLLIKTVQELSTEVEALKSQLKK